MNKYIKLMRVKHYIKNLLIFLPLIFCGNLFIPNDLLVTFVGFLSFSFIASSIYIFNDMIDIENDKKHPVKRFRPLASGAISKRNALILFFILIILSFCFNFFLFKTKSIKYSSFINSIFYLYLYFFLNLFYSKFGKNIPIIDIMILSFGFLLRVLYGGSLLNIDISSWLYLTILSFSLYLVIGKRRGELDKNKSKSRPVLKYYTKDFLSRFMYLFLALTLVFYSLWCTMGIKNSTTALIFSIFVVIFIVMKYSLIVEAESYGDPVDVLLSDKILIFSCIIYAIYMGVILYA